MTLFPEDAAAPAPRQWSRTTVAGVSALAVALVALLVLTFLPTSYVIQQQGPVVNTLGTAKDAEGEQVPLISVAGAETYPTSGALDLTTVQVRGSRDDTPSWFELATAWFDPSKAVVPIESVFPAGKTVEERNEENTALMVDSQEEATAAALLDLGYDVGARVAVHGFSDDSAAEGILEVGDIIVAADGTPIETTQDLRDVINAGEGAPITLEVKRDGETVETAVTPRRGEIDGEEVWLIGVTTMNEFVFPIDVTIQLDNIGGPSAGMMFALGIIDTLTPGELTGGEHIAGTGTIDAAGTVGPIGGIRQKLYGALDAGADYFLAPLDNCGEVVGHVPGDLQVVAVSTLDEAVEAVEAIAEGVGVEDLPTCAAG